MARCCARSASAQRPSDIATWAMVSCVAGAQGAILRSASVGAAASFARPAAARSRASSRSGTGSAGATSTALRRAARNSSRGPRVSASPSADQERQSAGWAFTDARHMESTSTLGSSAARTAMASGSAGSSASPSPTSARITSGRRSPPWGSRTAR